MWSGEGQRATAGGNRGAGREAPYTKTAPLSRAHFSVTEVLFTLNPVRFLAGSSSRPSSAALLVRKNPLIRLVGGEHAPLVHVYMGKLSVTGRYIGRAWVVRNVGRGGGVERRKSVDLLRELL